jgi:hypothetical protein
MVCRSFALCALMLLVMGVSEVWGLFLDKADEYEGIVQDIKLAVVSRGVPVWEVRFEGGSRAEVPFGNWRIAIGDHLSKRRGCLLYALNGTAYTLGHYLADMALWNSAVVGVGLAVVLGTIGGRRVQ